jgi:S-adenosylmethionine-diacylglycerol 3-amino-3-carboxypropyl transferase
MTDTPSPNAAPAAAFSAATEAAQRADFTQIRYAQCWEDADILLNALDIRDGDICLSIASAGDNSLSMLARGASKVISLDLNPSQLACLALRIAAYRSLEHAELLELIGSVPSDRRPALYAQCRKYLPEDARTFWDSHPNLIAAGIGAAGKFENYFRAFRKWIVPLIHSKSCVQRLLADKPLEARRAFYRDEWDTARWRWMFRLFFSRTIMGRFGRDPAFFQYVEGSVADRIAQRSRHALCELNPAENPYLQWILTGRHLTTLPHALRPEHFDAIRSRLDRIEYHCLSVEQYLAGYTGPPIRCFNLSDIFEYMSPANYQALLEAILSRAASSGRLAYWNMLVPRSRPETMANRLRPLPELAERLHLQDKAFFYSRVVVEEVL